MQDTIFARASGAGRSGVAVWRVSGPRARDICELISKRKLTPRRALLVEAADPATGAPIDRGLAILFAAPSSFTGEDVVEFQLHGSRAVEAALAEALVSAGARPAEAGEFTRRALINGKLDLAQVEALADLIDAETNEQRKQSLAQLEGRLSVAAEGWRRSILEILALLEAEIDFPDEEGVPAEIAARAGPAIDRLLVELRRHLSEAGRAQRLREGLSIAIIGMPNAGKSSLLNALAGADIAIVSETAGTTRDIVEARLDLGGIPAVVADTAGLRRMTEDEIELEGMRRALARAGAADLRILVNDPLTDDSAAGMPTGVSRETQPGQPEAALRTGDILVWSKADLGGEPGRAPAGVLSLRVSAKTGEGVQELIAALEDAAARLAGPSEGAPLTRLRHVAAVREAIAALERAHALIAEAPELAAEDARLAARSLGRITGAVDVEEVLGEIFSSFCIGK